MIREAKTGDVRAAAELFNRLIGRAGDAPVVAESVGVQHAPITTSPAEALAALDESANRPYDPYRGRGPDAASSTGGSG